VALHGTTPPRGEVLVSLYELDNSPMLSDPRHALQRQVSALAAQGLQPAGAFELEFFLLANERGPDGRVLPARDVLDGRGGTKTAVYSVDQLHGMLPLFNDIYAGAALAGIKAETLISEFGPGQYELTLHYRENVVQAADDLLRLKRIVRAQARAHGVTACFMPKPHPDWAGSGMHFHVSMLQGGRNVFVEEVEGQYNPLILQAIGGLRATMGEAMLVFAPHANSWRRFAAQSYAPVSPTWGVNNRSVALRIPAGDLRARRIEHRPSGVDANPYLVAAVVLAGIRHGWENAVDPGPMVTGNGYVDAPDAPVVPGDWRGAILAAKGSAFLRGALGEQMHRTFVAVLEAEYGQVMRTVPDVDFDLYLHTV
jgi:glutamine synthetase